MCTRNALRMKTILQWSHSSNSSSASYRLIPNPILTADSLSTSCSLNFSSASVNLDGPATGTSPPRFDSGFLDIDC